MVKHSVIRKVHAWGISQTDPFSDQQAAKALSASKSTIYASLSALAAAGFAAKSPGPSPARGGPRQTLYFITGSVDECAAAFSDGLAEKPNPLPTYARVASVFEYGERCAAANKGT